MRFFKIFYFKFWILQVVIGTALGAEDQWVEEGEEVFVERKDQPWLDRGIVSMKLRVLGPKIIGYPTQHPEKHEVLRKGHALILI